MSWNKTHSAKEAAFEKLASCIINAVKAKHPLMTDDEAMQHFIDFMRPKHATKTRSV